MDREFWMGPSFPQQPRELLNRLKSYGVCVVADALKGFNAMNGSIQPVVPGKCICGCAVTVRLHPGDNLLLHKAIESAQPGDILVLDTNSSYRRAVIGGIMSGAAFGKGIGGLVVDGAVRDVEGVSGMVTAVTHNATAYLPLSELVDIAAELERIRKEIEKAQNGLRGVEQKLSNEKFVSRAPEAVVNAEREKAAKYKELIAKLEESAKAMQA